MEKKKRIVVLGAGESGVGAAVLAQVKGFDVFVSDMSVIQDKYKEQLDRYEIPFEEGKHTPDLILNADEVVKSPGIPDRAPMIAALREKNIPIISEIEFAGRYTRARMICITGSNGKTTTTLLTCHILTTAGIDAGLAGNVGRSLAAQVAEDAHPLYVVELSSFQLDGMFDFRADIAVLTNITPDHLDRYDHKFENYIDSKFRILNNMRPQDLFIYGLDSEAVGHRLRQVRVVPRMAGFIYADRSIWEKNTCRSGAWMEGEEVVVQLENRQFRIAKQEISVQGRHNVYNAMAAILACMQVGVSDEKIAEGLRAFPQVEHRLETVRVVEGVTYINDSKATNVDSAWYALDSMTTPVIWIAGGTDKGNDYSVLFDLVRQKVKVLICMGADNRKLIDNFSGICQVVDTHSLKDALAAARQYAVEGDTVLLSPCCASFDLFKNYENRGELFKAAVKEL